MSPVYLYAVLAEAPAGPLPSGLSGEPVRLVACDDVWAAVGDVASAPAVDEASLRAHDAAVRRLARGRPRSSRRGSGPWPPTTTRFCDALRPAPAAFRDGLRAVRGCEQMTLRFARPTPGFCARSAPGERRRAAGPGTRYLDARRAPPATARPYPKWPASGRAGSLRTRRAAREARAPPLLASVYHLVPRESHDAYQAAVTAAARDAGLRVSTQRPWPPYAFAPDELA
jgi:hypothetical protein